MEVDRPRKVHLHYLNFAKREQALNGLRDGWAFVTIQYHNDMWEVVKIYDDPPRVRAMVNPWKLPSIHSRGMWLEENAPDELKVKYNI